jgi:hypothetical protein
MQVWGYQIERVLPLLGAPTSGITEGAALWRMEMKGRLPMADAAFIGTTGHLVYTGAAARAELTALSASESGPCAVLIPIRKSAAWWALPQDERQAYFQHASAHGHTAIGRVYAARIYRRLYHSRYLPGSEWDFLTYFEFPHAERAAFSELLLRLRDAAQNPEWSFVDRELEIWMTLRRTHDA